MSLFVYGTGAHVPDYMVKGGRFYRLVTDHLGSVRLVVDVQNCQVVQELAYDPFGRVLEDTNPGFQPFGFAGGLYDRAMGLVHFGAREYDAETGRWTSKDPLGFGSGDENVYVYVGSDPISYTDPAGDCPWCIGAVVGALTGGAIDLTIQLILNGGNIKCVDWGSVGAGAVSGAVASGVGPAGFLLGRGGIRYAPYGYNKAPGLVNRGRVRFGWSGPKGKHDVLSLRIDKQHFDVPGIRVPLGGRPGRDGAIAGSIAGAATGAAGSQDCCKQ